MGIGWTFRPAHWIKCDLIIFQNIILIAPKKQGTDKWATAKGVEIDQKVNPFYRSRL